MPPSDDREASEHYTMPPTILAMSRISEDMAHVSDLCTEDGRSGTSSNRGSTERCVTHRTKEQCRDEEAEYVL